MTCLKHKLRRRSDCPNCFPNSKEEKTSREMLADLEKEESELVIKAPRKKRESKVIITSTPTETNILVNEYVNSGQSKEFLKDPLEEFKSKINEMIDNSKNEIDNYFASKLQELKNEIHKETSILYEHLSFSSTLLDLSLLNKLELDGFMLVNIFSGDIAKASGFKESTAVFKRIKSDIWKKKIEEYKK